MKVVMFARVPRWYGFASDRIVLALAAAGIEVTGIVVETTSTVSSLREWIAKLGVMNVLRKSLMRLFRRSVAKSGESRSASPVASIAAAKVPVYHVSSHNNSSCLELLSKLQPDLLILRGCGIIKKSILEMPLIGTINPHYAQLPKFRGMDVTEWSVFFGADCRVSVHWVTPEVDGGAVILSENISTQGASALGDLRERCAALAATLISDAVRKIDSGEAKPAREVDVSGRQYFKMHPRIYKLTEQKLLSENSAV